MTEQVRIALLIGRGSRVPSILACARGMDSAKVVYVLSCIGEGIGIYTAREYKIPSGIIKIKSFGKTQRAREIFSKEIVSMLRECKTELIIMAGWMVIMPKSFVEEFPGRIINIHPSILPKYPGKGEDVIPKQWQEKAVPAGCTLHYVDEGMDSGKPILFGYVVQKQEDYKNISTFQDFETAIHAKEDEILCRGLKKIVRKLNQKKYAD